MTIKLQDFDTDNILINGKSYGNILIYRRTLRSETTFNN